MAILLIGWVLSSVMLVLALCFVASRVQPRVGQVGTAVAAAPSPNRESHDMPIGAVLQPCRS